MTTTGIVLIVVGAAVLAAAIWLLVRERRSKGLKSRFGPEYDHAVREFGSRPKAEDALARRERRMEKIPIHSLPVEQRERFGREWHDVQARFVDDPPLAIADADRLVTEAMRARGYPMGDFERRAEDLSVDHPHVVRNYRVAHDVAMAHEKGRASTEDLRKALVCYRDLFDELLEARMAGQGENRR